MEDIAVVRWPMETARRVRLSEAGQPRLLLIDHGAAPPDPVDCLEDWIRVPADDADVQCRLAGLAVRMVVHGASRPLLDGDGVLRCRGGWASLPPVEARLTGALLDRFGAVVSRETLGRAGWPDGVPGRNALDVYVLRLRRRVASVGLVIRTVRSRGYLMELASAQRVADEGAGRLA